MATPGDGFAKSASTMVTAEMRANAQRNIERYEWAQARKEDLQRLVEPYMEMDLERLWKLLPSQEIGRAVRPSSPHSTLSPHDIGCPQCYLNEGKDVGPTDTRVDLLNRPWQVQCEVCDEWYPKNDFASYYDSALDETGRFRLGEGDPQYLEPREGVTGEARQWIDNGTGIEYDAYRWYFVGVYADRMWREMATVVNNLATLYTLTDELAYARRAAIILDRMADFYPEMDEQQSRDLGMHTSYGPGRIMGRGWEYATIRQPVSEAYDLIYDALRNDGNLLAFVDRMSRNHNQPDKSSFEAFDAHLRENLLVEFLEDVMQHESPAKARGRAQTAMAVAAAALDDPERMPRYLEWLLAEGKGQLPDALVEHMQRDGFNVNSGHVYMKTTGIVLYRIAEILLQSQASNLNLYNKYPNLMGSFTMLSRTRVLDKTQPQMGDGGSSMSMRFSTYPMEMLLAGYRRFGTAAIAREIVRNHPDDWAQKVLEGSIYDKEPNALLQRIKASMPAEPEPHRSYNSGGTGFAALQAPYRENERAAGLWYGRTINPSHAHADRLTLHLWAFNTVLMPDMGYPAHTGDWPKRHGFTKHTISHNTLMINDTRQGASYSGKTRLFAEEGPLRVVDVDGLGVPDDRPWKDGRSWNEPIYKGVDTYRRAVIMVDVDEENSYLLDLFWARGGKNHRLIQNSGSRTATTEGLQMIQQNGGTFAGEEVAFGEFYDNDSDRHWGYAGTGFQYLKNVERDETPAESFRIVWPIHGRDGAYMRLHNLTQVDEVALADGEPSRGRPDKIRYSVRSRFGAALNTQFISVIEPYQGDPFIESVQILKRIENKNEPFAAVVEVTLKDGRRDVLMVREEAGELSVDDLSLNGRLGLIRYEADGQLETMIAIAAEELRAGNEAVRAPAVTGRLMAYDDSDRLNVRLRLAPDTPLSEELTDQYVIIANEEIADASYQIEQVENAYTLNLGQTSLFERLADPEDYGAGMLYNVQPGDRFLIPQSATWQRRHPSKVSSTVSDSLDVCH